MRRSTLLFAAFLSLLVFIPRAHAGGGPECWRRGGPPALAALMTEHADAIRRHREGSAVENWAKISADLDAVAAQRDAWASGLYWYTDLDQAKAAARRERKPIVSLRLLGRLDAELSCANSRFFRTTLYPAADVSRRMREHFVLHWSSERPVPIVSVDFGDGRHLQRTVTGNSAHYMMTSDGAVVDVLPGLYGAKPFAAWLDDAGRVATDVAALSQAERDGAIRKYHTRKRDEIAARWAADQRRAGATPANNSAAKNTSLTERWMTSPNKADAAVKAQPNAAPARVAVERAISKAFIERPVMKLVSVPDPNDADAALWSAIATLHDADAALDPTAVALIRTKRPSGNLATIVALLQQAIAQDTVRNEYTLHQTIHAWFASGSAPAAFERLNERVYAELFLTPRADPWLGLAPAGAWSGLEDDGLSSTATAATN